MAECIFHVYVLAPQNKTFPKIVYLELNWPLFFELWLFFHFYGWNICWKNMGLFGLQVLQRFITSQTPQKCTINGKSLKITHASAYLWSAVHNFDVFPINSAGFRVGNISIFNDQWSLIYMTVCSTKIDTGTSFSVGTATVLLFMSSMTAGSHSSKGRKKHSSPIWQDFSRCKTKHKMGPVISFK